MATSGKSKKGRHAATLADVGRAAGVSAMAASAVLNGARTSSRISEDTRNRILAAAKTLNYRPNAAARALADRRMNTIGVATLLDRRELNQYFLEVFNGIIEAAAEAGQNTTVFAISDWKLGPQRIPSICDGRIDGLILLAPWIDGQEAKHWPDHTPIVSVHGNAEMPGVINVESDEGAGAYEMVRHMLCLGHRRILHVSGPESLVGARRRIEGYRRAHHDAKVRIPPGYIVAGEYTTESGRVVMEEWIQKHRGEALPEAIFCANDATAFGCLETLARHGLRVPQDVSVVGFDDTLLARSAHLATVRQPLQEMGHRAVQLLMGRIEAKHQDTTFRSPHNIIVPTELVLGQSLGRPRPVPFLLP